MPTGTYDPQIWVNHAARIESMELDRVYALEFLLNASRPVDLVPLAPLSFLEVQAGMTPKKFCGN